MPITSKWAKVVDTVTSIILFSLAGYHFSTISPTNASWRSGTIETISGLLLLASAYRLPRTAGIIINGVLAVAIAALGSYHFTHGGMGSGVTEWVLAIGLGSASVSIYKRRP